MSTVNISKEVTQGFQLKGGLYPLTAIQLISNNLSAIEQQLEQKIKQAPKFFQNAPIVIDLNKINLNFPIDFNKLKDILHCKQLIPVGIKGGSLEHITAAIAAGFAVIQDTQNNQNNQKQDSQKHDNQKQTDPNETDLKGTRKSNEAKENRAETFAVRETSSDESCNEESRNTAGIAIPEEIQNARVYGSNTKIIQEPVRSGQQIYARNGDLIVLAPVSHGSELLADGNIHVYGPLRGRALAGVTGDTKTHIFCKSIEAELISIAGQYKISEDIDETLWETAVDIYFEDDRLHIRPL